MGRGGGGGEGREKRQTDTDNRTQGEKERERERAVYPRIMTHLHSNWPSNYSQVFGGYST